jgi:aspartyl aminopeptidase
MRAFRAPIISLLALRSASGASMPIRTASARLLSTAPAVSETQKAAMAFLDGSPDPFHACARAQERLEAAGFVKLDEREPWAGRIAPGGRYFWTRNRSCLVAFAVGEGYQPGDGFKIIGAHTDSPNLKVKPRSVRDGSAASCTQVLYAWADPGTAHH